LKCPVLPWLRRVRPRTAHSSIEPKHWALFLLGCSAWLVYSATAAMDVLPADSGEFQLVAAGWGIAHPPGYPLYTLVGALWVHLLPWGSMFHRLNLLSSLLAAITLVMTAQTVMTWTRSQGLSKRATIIGAFAATLTLALAPTFWAQATTANIRMPTMLFVAWGYQELARYSASQRSGITKHDRILMSLALATGLGIGHHPSLVFIAVGWLFYLWWLDPHLPRQPRRWWRPLGMALAGWGLPQLYLLIRGSMADVPLNPGSLTTWTGFWHHVLARGFGGDMFAYAAPADLKARLPLLPVLFRMQFPIAALILMAGIWIWLTVRRPRLGWTLGISWLLQTFVTITYRAPQTVEYLMPAFIPMVLTLGIGISGLIQALDTRHALLSRGLTIALALMLGSQAPGRIRDFGLLSLDTSTRSRVAPLLQHAPPGGVILADWRWATPLWGLQAIESLGSDAEVHYVVPVPTLQYEEAWLQQVQRYLGRPLFTTHAYDWPEWNRAPVGGGFRLYSRPLETLPSQLGYNPLEAEAGSVRLLGFRWTGSALPGQTLELQLAWQVMEPNGPMPSFATRLWASDGTMLSAADRALGTDLIAGEVRFTELTHQLPIDVCSPEVMPTVGVYIIQDGAFQDLGQVTLPNLAVSCRYPKLPTQRIWPGFVWPNGPLLRGLDYDVQEGSAVLSYWHWCGPGGGLILTSDAGIAQVSALNVGECQTVRLPMADVSRPVGVTFQKPDGTPARLISFPLPSPLPGEHYRPFGDELVLTDVRLAHAPRDQEATLVTTWHTARPLVNDYAISVRLLRDDGQWVGMHDMQPGLGALPTLKWLTRGMTISTPHPFQELMDEPTRVAIVLYERFRLTPLKAGNADVVVYPLQ